jgi:cephalosporin-C deacetylase-like acetyl esterase
MPREDIQFNTRDNVTLRGWFYTPQGTANEKRPCIILAHGFAAVKEMTLDKFAEYFSTNLAVCALVYDHRNFGDSDGKPRQDVNHFLQCSDYSDAITYAQMRAEVDKDRIGLWGSSYSGGHVLHVAAVDRRVKAVISQVM